MFPGPTYPNGLAARVHAVATRPDFRRRGYARAVLTALVEQLHTEHVTLFELHASEEAAPLYRDLGFASSAALMRMTRLEEPAVISKQATGRGPRDGGGGSGWMPLEVACRQRAVQCPGRSSRQRRRAAPRGKTERRLKEVFVGSRDQNDMTDVHDTPTDPVSPLPSLLAVLAHPDDEALVCGGVLAQHAEAGARTAVVTATWAADSPRASELADSLSALGLSEAPRMLGYADHRVPESAPGRPRWCDVRLDEAVGQLVAHIRQVKPDVVITHDAHGQLTGHPDHRRTHQMTLLAVTAAGLGQLYADMGPPWQPASLYLATHPESSTGDLGELLRRADKAVLSVPDQHVITTVDVRPWLARK